MISARTLKNGGLFMASLILRRSELARLYSLLSPSDVPCLKACSLRSHVIVYEGPITLRVRNGPWEVNMFISLQNRCHRRSKLYYLNLNCSCIALLGTTDQILFWTFAIRLDNAIQKMSPLSPPKAQWDLRGTTCI